MFCGLVSLFYTTITVLIDFFLFRFLFRRFPPVFVDLSRCFVFGFLCNGPFGLRRGSGFQSLMEFSLI